MVLGVLPFVSLLLWTVISRWSLSDPFPRSFTLSGWRYIVRSGDIPALFRVTGYAIAVALVSCALSLVSARTLAESRSRIAPFFEALFFFPALVPVLCMTLAVHQWAVWYVPSLMRLPMFSLYLFFSFPYAFRVIYSAYRGGIQASRETAAVLGANSWQTLFRVELPLIAPHVTIAFAFAFAVAYGQYIIEAFFLTGKHTVFSIRMAAFLESSNRTTAAVYTVFYIALGVCVVLLPAAAKRITADRGGLS